MTITYVCPECEAETQIEVSPIVPAKIHGPPEHCHPAEGGEFDVEECPQCGTPVDERQVYRKLEEAIIDQRAMKADAAEEREKDRRMGL